MYFENQFIKLVALDISHLDIVHNWINNEIINESSGTRFPISKENQKNWILKTIQNKSKKKLIILNNENLEVGMVSIMNIDYRNRNAELGVYLDPDHVRKGYASMALSMLIDFGFQELNMHKLYAFIHADNKNSIRLFEKLNFSLESKHIDEIYKKGKFFANLKYSLFKEN